MYLYTQSFNITYKYNVSKQLTIDTTTVK